MFKILNFNQVESEILVIGAKHIRSHFDFYFHMVIEGNYSSGPSKSSNIFDQTLK